MEKNLVCQKEFDQSGLWSNIFSLRDELGQVFKIYSSVEGRQGTSAREPSRTLTPDLIRLFQKMQFETYRTDQIKMVAS